MIAWDSLHSNYCLYRPSGHNVNAVEIVTIGVMFHFEVDEFNQLFWHNEIMEQFK